MLKKTLIIHKNRTMSDDLNYCFIRNNKTIK